jgi:hypothetical protein
MVTEKGANRKYEGFSLASNSDVFRRYGTPGNLVIHLTSQPSDKDFSSMKGLQ